jgi:glycosyltransferase involved in cell wall biosynthesis
VRIIQFVNNLDMGGLERLVVELGRCQLADGHQPFIYCLTHPGTLATEAEAAGIGVRAFEKPPGPHPGTALRVANQLRRDRPDVLHTHNHLVHHYGVAAGLLTSVPVIVNTRHGPGGSVKSQDRKADLIFRTTLPWVDAVVLISETTRQFFIQHRGVPAAKTRVILNGVKLERFLNAPAHPGSAPGRVRFGIAARLVREKDFFTLLRAFEAVAGEIPEAELHIAGDGPLRESIVDFARELKHGNRVTLLGALADTSQFYAQLDVFVLSSLNEGLPIALLEAMAAGLPVVCTRAGGVPEAVVDGHNGYLTAPGDSIGLAQAMIRMARQPDLERMGALGRTIAQDRFPMERTWEEYYKLFVSLSPQPRPRN